MAITEREEFFLENGQLARRTGRRPSGRGMWPNAKHLNLAVAVEMSADGIHRVFRGAQHTKEFEMEAVARTYDFHFGDETGPDVGRHIPEEVVARIRTRVDEVAKKVAGRYRFLSNEERMTGALFGGLPREIEMGDWKVRFHNQGYSSVQKNAKETTTGADAGVVVEVRDRNTSVLKALWLQAKRVPEAPDQADVSKLPRLKEQMTSMSGFTRDGYALIFTPTEVYVTDGQRRWPFAEWLVQAARCERGDRRREMIVNTIDRDYLLEMTVTH
jgi:hypothetical protein